MVMERWLNGASSKKEPGFIMNGFYKNVRNRMNGGRKAVREVLKVES